MKPYQRRWNLYLKVEQARLLLATISAFCTTDPPESTLFPYICSATYALFCLSLGMVLSGFIVGSCVVFVMGGASRTSFAMCVHSSDFRFYVHDVAKLRYKRLCTRREGCGERFSYFRTLSLPWRCRSYGSPLVSWTV